MKITQEQFDIAVLEVTSGESWEIVKKGLENDIYHSQARAFDAKDWGEVQELKGFARGIAYCMRLRETVINAHEQEKANADL